MGGERGKCAERQVLAADLLLQERLPKVIAVGESDRMTLRFVKPG